MDNKKQKIDFKKYKLRGAYHWEQVSRNPMKRNPFVVSRYENVLKLLENELDIRNKKILDLGCGDGVLTNYLNTKKSKAYGIDYSSEAINFAKEKTASKNINFIQGSAYELPFSDNYFDAIVSSDVIEHLDNVDKYLEEIKRVLKYDGIVVISTPIKFTEYPLDKMHVIEWFPDEFKAVIDSKFEQSKYFYSHPVFWLELMQRRFRFKLLINIFDLLGWNPFKYFNTKFKYNSLQYSVSIKK